MLAALVGGAAAGVPGALVAVPLLGASKAIWLELRGEAREPPPRRRLRMPRLGRRGHATATGS
jgi:predicted PurR-regulated permease PerM